MSEPLEVAYDWDYDMRFIADSVSEIHLSRVPRITADADDANPWPRLILVMTGAIVWIVAPVVAALWGWQLQERKGNLWRRALAFLMPPVVALAATLGFMQGLALEVQRQVPQPICGTPVAALVMVGGFWVLIVGSVNAACLLGDSLHPRWSVGGR